MLNSEILEEIEKKIRELEELKKEVTEDEGIEIETLESVEKRVETKPRKPKYMTGIGFLDRRMGGFEPGSFVNIAGANFSGKTELVMTILSNIAESRKALFFSFEMYEDLIVRRVRHLSREQKRNILIEQRRNDIDSIESIIRAYAERGVGFVAIDSRMKIAVPGKSEEWAKNSEISRRLSKLTQELGIVLLLINQVSEHDLRTGRPSLKGSGDQAYDSDVILFIAPHKDDLNKRVMVCEKDRINGKKWVEEYTLADLRSSDKGCVEIVYEEAS